MTAGAQHAANPHPYGGVGCGWTYAQKGLCSMGIAGMLCGGMGVVTQLVLQRLALLPGQVSSPRRGPPVMRVAADECNKVVRGDAGGLWQLGCCSTWRVWPSGDCVCAENQLHGQIAVLGVVSIVSVGLL